MYSITIPGEEENEPGHTFLTESARMERIARKYGWKVKWDYLFSEKDLTENIEMYEAGIGKVFFCVSFIGNVVAKVSKFSAPSMFWASSLFERIETDGFQSSVAVAAKSEEDAIQLACEIMNKSKEPKANLKTL